MNTADKTMEDFSRYTLSYSEEHPEEQKEIAKEHLQRAKQGKTAWNKWASEFKQYIEENEITDAQIDFRSAEFNINFSFFGLNFICNADFREATFSGYANFREATFSGYANFSEATFSGDAYFRKATFSGDAYFRKATFSGNADFSEATFSGNADFSEATFSGNAYFHEATFSGNAYFIEAIFSGNAYFSEAIFNGYANFSEATFSGNANFTNSIFKQQVSFQQCQFPNHVPDFNYATFKQTPTLNNVGISFSDSRGIEELEKYRRLKSMAQDGNDHENELRFFGYETHTKAYLKETPLLQKTFIKSYYWLSNFGTSFVRPWVWICLFLTFMIFTNYQLISPDSTGCKQSKYTFFVQASTYTLSQSFPLITLEDKQKEVMNNCLFGSDKGNVKTLWHSFWRIFHLVPTTILLFLFGLAMRNRFKIS